jgi:hypothetical protein
MNAKELVDSLFAGYEETAALADFKEELLGNLNAKIESMMKKGMDQQTAFEKAGAELGDISALADELSRKKRKEVFEEAYMDIRNYMPAGRVIAYIVFSMTALFGIIAALITYFATKGEISADLGLTSSFGALIPFFTAAAAGFTFLGLTQETASQYPAGKKRAAWYALAAGLIAFGITTAPVTLSSISYGATLPEFPMLPPGLDSGHLEMAGALGVLLIFALPGAGLLAFLILTEKDRLKPWAKEFRAGAVKREMELWNDPATAARFGLFSGAIWIFAIGLFILLGFIIGFKLSWLVFIFAVAIQLVVQGLMSKSEAAK